MRLHGGHSDGWKNRMAAQVASTLPDDDAEALEVLELAKQIVMLGSGEEHRADASPEQQLRIVASETRLKSAASSRAP